MSLSRPPARLTPSWLFDTKSPRTAPCTQRVCSTPERQMLRSTARGRPRRWDQL